MDTTNTGACSESDKPQSIPEIAKMLEKGQVDPDSLGKVVLKQCAMFFRLQRYPDDLIGSIVGKDPRTVRRYVRSAKTKNVLAKFVQSDYIAEMISGFKEQRLRALKFVYSNELKPGEVIRAMQLVHSIEMNQFEVLGRYGYISKHQAEIDIKEMPKKKKTWPGVDKEWEDLMGWLSGLEREEILQFLNKCIETEDADGIIKAKALARELINKKDRNIMAYMIKEKPKNENGQQDVLPTEGWPQE